RMAITSCVRCLVLVSRHDVLESCVLTASPLHASVQDVLCIPTGVWPLRPALDYQNTFIPTGVRPLRPALDVWKQSPGMMSLSHACSRPSPCMLFS
ncbi:14782_t:CDS:2, partial [Funneliformis caledonium]